MYRKAEIKISLIIFFYGLFANNFLILENKEKAFIGIFLFSIPLLFQLIRASELVKIYAIWFGVFLISQSILICLLNNSNYVTLKPNINKKIYINPGILAGLEGQQSIITDSKGFRVTKEIDYKNKAVNKYRIFAIGASTTEQIYTDQFRTWTNLLQEKLSDKYPHRDFEVINTGASGLRAVNHLATLEKIINYHPDMVIFLMGINDWNHHIISHFDNEKPETSYQKFVSIVNKSSFETSWNKIYLPIRNKIRSRVFGIHCKKELEMKNSPYKFGTLFKNDQREFKPDDVMESYKEQISQMNKICDDYQIKCVFLTQPNGYKKSASAKYKEYFWMTPSSYTLTLDNLQYISKLYNDYMKNFAMKNNKIMCDLDAKIPASLDYMYDDCHFNINGTKKVSEVLFNCIENKL